MKNHKYSGRILVLVLWLFATALPGAMPAGATTQYYFNYYLGDGSGDYYTGYVYAPDNWFQVGSTLHKQPAEMGETPLGGYYQITAVQPDAPSSYDRNEYINSFYDASTGKTSYTLYSDLDGSVSNHALYIPNRSTTAENGYVYDPAVPSTDSLFGLSETAYYFDTSQSKANFLEVYFSDQPQWSSPSEYPNSAAEVAGATILAHWDSHGYPQLIPADWQNWTNTSSSYIALISELAIDMNWNSTSGTDPADVGPGLEYYALFTFIANYYDVSADRSGTWNTFKDILDAGCPVIYLYHSNTEATYHLSRGYWEDGTVLITPCYSNPPLLLAAGIPLPWIGLTTI